MSILYVGTLPHPEANILHQRMTKYIFGYQEYTQASIIGGTGDKIRTLGNFRFKKTKIKTKKLLAIAVETLNHLLAVANH